MRRKYPLVLAMLFSVAGLVRPQSLGDAAKANRDKQAAAPTATVVVTNDDLQTDSRTSAPAPAQSGKSVKTQPRKPAVRNANEIVDPQVAEAWRQKILQQKEAIQVLQAKMDQLNVSIHPPGGAEFDGPPSRDRAKLMQRLADTQLQFDSQKRKLEQMQEQARRAGMHTPTYDP
jgi:hypothetical protein